MNAQEIINFIHDAEKKTPVKVYFKSEKDILFPNCHQFADVVFGDWKDIEPVLTVHKEDLTDVVIENDCRNSAVPLLDLKNIRARIEPGALIRDQVEIGDNAVIMMGAMDNLVKGAAGQAVQNMNLMFGLPEETGLTLVPLFP